MKKPEVHRTIFVFGSNLAGRHGKGAAEHAHKFWGAERGIGEGLTGNAYAIPTKDYHLKQRKLLHVADSIRTFCDVARSMPECRFLVTPVGTGLAGFSKSLMWNAFRDARMPDNCFLTSSWMIDDGPENPLR